MYHLTTVQYHHLYYKVLDSIIENRVDFYKFLIIVSQGDHSPVLFKILVKCTF